MLHPRVSPRLLSNDGPPSRACGGGLKASTSESKVFTDEDRRNSARLHNAIDDQNVVYAAWHAIRAARSLVLEWKAVLVNAPKSSVNVRNDLLRSDNENHLSSAGDNRTKLTSASRCNK